MTGRSFSLAKWYLGAFVCLAVLSTGAAGAKKDKKKEAASGGEAEVPYQDITDCPRDPGCPALIIIDETKLDQDQIYTGYSRRQVMKIFTQEGVDRYSDLSISFWAKDSKVKNLRGQTILPDGTKIPLAEENIKVKNVRVGKRKERTMSAAFPGVVPGALIAWAYRLRLEHAGFDDTWNIQKSLPVLESRYYLKHGPYYYGWNQVGMEKVEVETDEESSRELRFTARNVPALPDEPFGPNDRAVRARMRFYLPEYDKEWVRFVAGLYAKTSGEFIDDAPGVAEKAAELASDSDPVKVKLGKIYDFVQREIRTEEQRLQETEEENLEDAENAGEVLARGYGNELERTLLFLALAKEAGLNGALMLISSRYNGPLDLEVPDPDVFDSFAAAVQVGSGWTSYDPATPHCELGMISPEKEGVGANGMMLQPGRYNDEERLFKVTGFERRLVLPITAPYTMVEVQFSPSERNVLTREATVRLRADGSAEVEMSEVGTGQVDLAQRETYELLEEEERREHLQEEANELFPDGELLEATFENLTSFEESARIGCKMEVPGLAEVIGDRFVVSPSVFHLNRTNPFAAEKRRTPIYFPYAYKSVEEVTFVLPEGYRMDPIPESTVIRQAPFELLTSYTPTEEGFRFVRRMSVDAAQWPLEKYAELQAFYNQVQEADRQAIVLKKQAAGS